MRGSEHGPLPSISIHIACRALAASPLTLRYARSVHLQEGDRRYEGKAVARKEAGALCRGKYRAFAPLCTRTH